MVDDAPRDGLWPLPGGVTSYFDTAIAILDEVHARRPTPDELFAFLQRSFAVRGRRSGDGYVAVLRRIRWIERDAGRYMITARGEVVRSTRSREEAFADLAARFSGIDETLALVEGGVTSANDLRDELNARLGTRWEHTVQATVRLNWLRSLGKVHDEEVARRGASSATGATAEVVALYDPTPTRRHDAHHAGPAALADAVVLAYDEGPGAGWSPYARAAG
ncbi:MAG: hypothetical protein IPF99_30090 [Deltaproteobacteria bacterium]|nr:hypothetical protein [Deltaproteobacteria bacterium]